MRWNHWLRVKVVWPLEDLVWFYYMCSMRSHIHAWNMAQWFLDGREIWFNLVYGRVVHGSPIPSWLMKSSIRTLFLIGILWVNILVDMWYLWLLYPCYFCWLYAHYEHVLWQQWCMALIMFWFLNELSNILLYILIFKNYIYIILIDVSCRIHIRIPYPYPYSCFLG